MVRLLWQLLFPRPRINFQSRVIFTIHEQINLFFFWPHFVTELQSEVFCDIDTIIYQFVIFSYCISVSVSPTFAPESLLSSSARHSVGDTKQPFCLQSCVKPLQYAIAVHEAGTDKVHRYVGMEPSGLKFNMLSLDDEGV